MGGLGFFSRTASRIELIHLNADFVGIAENIHARGRSRDRLASLRVNFGLRLHDFMRILDAASRAEVSMEVCVLMRFFTLRAMRKTVTVRDAGLRRSAEFGAGLVGERIDYDGFARLRMDRRDNVPIFAITEGGSKSNCRTALEVFQRKCGAALFQFREEFADCEPSSSWTKQD